MDMQAMKERVEKMRSLKKNIDVVKFIGVHMIFDHSHSGWVHSHNMWELFNLPDLEIRNVKPLFMMVDAGLVINHVAQYMVDGWANGEWAVKSGEKMGFGAGRFVKFLHSKPIDEKDKAENESHFSSPRLQLVDVPELFRCGLAR